MSKSFKSNTYYTATSAAIINARTPKGDKPNISGSANELLRRYDWLVKQSLPELSNAEWQALCNVYAGTWLSEFVAPARIASDMMDDIGAISLEEISDPDYATLVRKAHDWSQAEQLAALDFIQQFWCGDWDGYESFGQIKQAILGRSSAS